MSSRYGKIMMGLALGSALLIAACATAPYTGRRQVILESKKTELSTAAQSFDELIAKDPTCQDPAIKALVNRVGRRLAAAADRPDYHWEFIVLENPLETRAFCFSGGQTGIFTGALKYTRDEAGLATVLAHEMGHALARHTAERQSEATLAHVGGMGLGFGVGSLAGQSVAEGYSLGIRHGILPQYTWTQELEADKIGLILMAKAGYDPALALDFWRRMMTDEDVKLRPPQFLKGHPRNDRHMKVLVDFLPKAKEDYVPVAKAPAAPAAPSKPPAPAAPAPGQAAPPSAPATPESSLAPPPPPPAPPAPEAESPSHPTVAPEPEINPSDTAG